MLEFRGKVSAEPRRPGAARRASRLAALLALLLSLPAAGAAEGLPERTPRPAPDVSRAAPFAPSVLPSALGSPVDCVILSPDSLADLFQPLADYQTRVGIPSVVRPLSIIRAADPRSNDLPQAVRTFLRRARDAWGTRWAILVGDQDALPMRYVRVTYFWPEDIPTDAYYADLDGSWDGNGNGIYGEVADSLDMNPDIAVGRFSVATRADAQAVVRKTLRYAIRPLLPADDRELFMAEVLSPIDWTPGQPVIQDAARAAESLRVHLPGCKTVDRYYENAGSYPGSIPLDRAGALAALNRGYSVVDYMGHGYHSQVSVGTELLKLPDFSSLSNGDSLYLFIASNCATAAIDFDCIGERMLRNPAGGCFAYIGPTRNDFPGVAARMNTALYDSLYAGRPTSLGEAMENVRASLLPKARAESQERWGYFETVLLGAPTVPVWRCAPETLLVTHPVSVSLDDGSFQVTVTQGGAPAESALVVAWKSPDDYRAVLTDASGAATVPFHPATAGGFSLAVTRAGALPYLDSLTVTPSASGVHFGVEVTGIGDGAEGNGDGRADAGEAFAIEGSLSNTGPTPSAAPVTLTYEAVSGGLVVEKGSAELAAIAAGGSVPLPDSLRVRAAATPNAGRSELLRIVATDGARSDTSEVPLEVVAASLAPATCVFSDAAPGGDGDGVVDPGETVSFTWTIGNEGPGAARGVTARLLDPSGGGAILDTTGAVGDIAVGAAAPTPALAVTAGSDVSARLFDLELSDVYGHTWSYPIDAVAPGAPAGLVVLSSGLDRIRISWSPPGSAGIAGYRIYSAPDDGSPLVAAAVPVRGSAVYEDGGLAALTRYRYAVAAVDSSGNESARSAELVASTTPPDAPGWPLPLGRATSGSVLLADLDQDGKPEICVGADYLYVFRSDGSEWRDGDLNPTSVGVFSTALHYLASSPAAADLDLDGVPELIAASWDDSLVAVFGADGALRPGWPKKGAAPFWSTPAIGDIDNDGAAEIVVGSNSNRLYAWHADGLEVRDGDGNAATDGIFFLPTGTVISSPVIADLDRDGRREIIFGTSAGRVYALRAAAGPAPFDTAWIFQAPGVFSGSPAVGEIQPGGDLEVAITSHDSVYVLTSTGDRAPGWPKALGLDPGNGRAPSPVLAPLRIHLADPTLDVIVAGAGGQIIAWDPAGNVVPGWGSVQVGATEASPAVADLDGDGSPEVLIGSEDRRLYAFHADGTPVSGFPIETGAEVRSTPAVWDLDGDGSVEIAISGWDAELHVWRYPGTFAKQGMIWPMWRHDNWRTGVYAFPVLTSVEPEPPPPAPAPPPALPRLLQNRPNPFNPSTTIRLAVPGPASEYVALRVFDARGRLVATLCSRPLDPGYHDFPWDGRDDRGVSLGSGIYFYRASIGRTVLTRKMALLK